MMRAAISLDAFALTLLISFSVSILIINDDGRDLIVLVGSARGSTFPELLGTTRRRLASGMQRALGGRRTGRR